MSLSTDVVEEGIGISEGVANETLVVRLQVFAERHGQELLKRDNKTKYVLVKRLLEVKQFEKISQWSTQNEHSFLTRDKKNSRAAMNESQVFYLHIKQPNGSLKNYRKPISVQAKVLSLLGLHY